MSQVWQAYLQYSARDGVSSVSNQVQKNVTKNNNKIKLSFTSLKTAVFRNMRQINSAIGQVSAASLAGGAAMAAFGVKTLSDTAKEVDRFKNQMLVATGTLQGANDEWERAKALADETGASLSSITDTYGKFSVAAKSAGMSSKEMNSVYKELIKGTVAMGLGQENVKLALKAVEQMMSKGQVMAEELKGQFGEQIPDAMGLTARAVGVTTGELLKMMEKGELLSKDVVPKLARQMGIEWGDAAKRGASQIMASQNRIGTSFVNLKEAINKAGAGEAMKNMYNATADMINNITDLVNTKGQKISDLMIGMFDADSNQRDHIIMSYEITVQRIKMVIANMTNWVVDNVGVGGLLTLFVLGRLRLVQKVFGVVAKMGRKLISKFKEIWQKIKDLDFSGAKAAFSGLTTIAAIELATFSAEVDKALRIDTSKMENDLKDLEQQFSDMKLLDKETKQFDVEVNVGKVGDLKYALEKHDAIVNEQAKMLAEQDMGFETTATVKPTYNVAGADATGMMTARKEYIKAQQEEIASFSLTQAKKFMQRQEWNMLSLEEQKAFLSRMRTLNEEALRDESLRTYEISQFSMEQARKFGIKEDWNKLSITQQEAYLKRMLELSQQYADEEKKLTEVKVKKQSELQEWLASDVGQGTMAMTSAMSSMFGQMASMQDKSTKKGFENWKAMATAQALINTAMSVTNALANVPAPFNVGVASMMGAMGAMQIAMIQRQQYQPRMTGGNVQAGQTYMTGERGRELFVPSTNGRIYPNDVIDKSQPSKQVIQAEKPVNVNFTINAADASDMDRLIMERMPLIVNGVRRGMA